MSGPLRRPAFARLWLGGMLSETGDWLLHISLPLFVLGLTGSPLITAVTFMLGLLPSVVCAPIGGVLADRWDRRRMIVWVSVAQAALLLPLLAVDGPDRLWLVLVVTGAQAALAAVFEPAKNALVPVLVEPDQLAGANGLIGFASSMGRLLGGPLGGVVLQVWGIHGVVLADALSFLVVAALMAPRRGMPVSGAGERPPFGKWWRQWTDGLRVVLAPGPLRPVAIIAGLLGLAQGMFVALFVFYVTDVLGAGEAETGLLRGVQAIGGLAGGLIAGWLARRMGDKVLAGGSLLVFALIGVLGWNGPYLTTALWVYIGLFAAIGAPAVTGISALLALLQRSADPRQLGKAMGGFQAISDGAQGIGMLASGALVGVLPISVLLNAQISLYALAGFLLLAGTSMRHPTPVPA
ncbi:MFS transporter [Labedaea rhizosphaerae]|uniref:Putative MFS family arabinose efflux permease n=1 Tax=Labedaea rhizosphaerae TaxID=598644 RepID=A0A4R6S8F1_LABRH|nr:MFS transporter [Labedaea rhizosphaerae]TDP95136.1 putative MFS family arabinose efflux permease [Labedaea rhizosphaerae]